MTRAHPASARRARKSAVLRALDVAYDTDTNEETWLTRITSALAPLLDDGTGVHGLLVDLAAPSAVSTPVLIGGHPAWRDAWRAHWWDEMMLRLPRTTLEAMLRFGATSYASELFAATASSIDSFAELLDRMEDKGFRHALATARGASREGKLFYPESLNVIGIDATGVGVALVANRRQRAAAPLAAPERERLSALAGHLAAAMRLRRRLRPGRAGTAGAEGIVGPRGEVLHAEGPAATRTGLAALRAAARAVIHARGPTLGDPLEHWRALHSGRWTVVERFESDGRRILVARENRVRATMPADGLSPREAEVLGELALGHTNKEIAYRIGVSQATVASHLRSTSKKLGLATVRALLRHARMLAEEGVRAAH